MKQPLITKAFGQAKFKIYGFNIIDLGYMFLAVILSLIVGVSVSNNVFIKIVAMLGILIVFAIGLIPTPIGMIWKILPSVILKFISKNIYESKEEIANELPIKKIEVDFLISKQNTKNVAFEVNGIDLSILEDKDVELKIKLYEQFLKSLDVEVYQIKIDKQLQLDKYEQWLTQHQQGTKNAEKIKQLDDYINQIKEKELEYNSKFYLVFSSKDNQSLQNAIKNLKIFFSKIELTYKQLENFEFINLLKDMYFDFDKDDFTQQDIKEHIDNIDYLLSYDNLKIKNNYMIFANNEYETYISCKTLKEYASSPDISWFFDISTERGTVVSRISPLKQQQINRMVNNANIKARVNQKLNKQVKLTDVITEEANIDSIQELAANLKLGNEKLFLISTTFISFGDSLSDLKENENNIKLELSNNDFVLSNQSFKQFETFINSFPLGLASNKNIVLKQEISSWALANSFAFVDNNWTDISGIYFGDTLNYSPFIIDFFKRKSNVLNCNATVIGASGSGKSVTMKKLVNFNCVAGIKTIIFDPERTEFLPLIKKWNGQIINVALGNKTKINPLEIFKNVENDNLNINSIISNHLQVLEEWFSNLFSNLEEIVLEAFLISIQNCYKNSKFYNKPIKDWTSQDFPTFDDLKPYVLDEVSKAQSRLIRLEYIINNFVGNGKYANLWNGYTNIDLTNDLILFDFADFGSGGQNTRIKAAQLSLLVKIVDNIIWNNDLTIRQPIQIIVDEAHTFISSDNTYALNMMSTFARRIRKRNGSFILATQNISDFVKPGAIKDARDIINNTQFSFIGKLMPQDLKDLDTLYSKFNGFTENEMTNIRTQEVGNFLFINGGIEKIFFKTNISDLEKQNIGIKKQLEQEAKQLNLGALFNKDEKSIFEAFKNLNRNVNLEQNDVDINVHQNTATITVKSKNDKYQGQVTVNFTVKEKLQNIANISDLEQQNIEIKV
ncbi:Mbov_0397 family ICE element conjugal transfer ATPase [Mycoplasma capricolum]|uniref:Mbov_0397 family ICE element conjugal transfer ATPase n=2 Tax=Mycoplasma capricolum TaxID=2095 RepID=UPI003DA3BB3B